jgi:transcriptional regulator with XRE-family HTH domain
MTQKELAEKLDVSQPLVSKWMSGQCIPRPETLQKISEATGVDLQELTLNVYKKYEEKTNIVKLRQNTLKQRAFDFLKENPNTWYTCSYIAKEIRKKHSDYDNKPVNGNASSKEEMESHLLMQLTREISTNLSRYLDNTPEDEHLIERFYVSPHRVKYKFKQNDTTSVNSDELQKDLLDETINLLFAKLANDLQFIGKSQIVIEKKHDNVNFTVKMNIE